MSATDDGEPPTAYAAAMARLRAARDALNALDLGAAADLLASHDAALRAAFADAGAPAFAVAEAEALAHAQAELLAQLQAVQRGVAADLGATRRGGAAARAYLDARGD